MHRASHQDRVRAATDAISGQTLQTNLIIGGISIPRHVAQKLAELAVNAVVAEDQKASERTRAAIKAAEDALAESTRAPIA